MSLAQPVVAPLRVKKRSGSVVDYKKAKITQVVKLCLVNGCRRPDNDATRKLSARVSTQVDRILRKREGTITVEDIQDMVEQQLMACGEYDAARHYVLYREEHRRLREEAPVAPETKKLFADASAVFAGKNRHVQQVQAFDKFSRFQDSLGRREVWPESVDRVMAFTEKHCHEQGFYDAIGGHDLFRNLRHALLTLEAAPSMRLMQMAGPALERCHVGVYNCLAESTRFVTADGVRSFEDFSDGDETVVLTHAGRWKNATVRNYGRGELHKYVFVRGRTRLTEWATENHRWLLDAPVSETYRARSLAAATVESSAARSVGVTPSLLAPDTAGSGFWETTSLMTGDRLAKAPMPFEAWRYEESPPLERLYWAYGYIYGDGTVYRDSRGAPAYSGARLCGNDAKYLSRFQELGFGDSTPLSCAGDPFVYTGKYTKTLPDISRDGVDLVRAFVRGYLDADGAKPNVGSGRNQFSSIQATGRDSVRFIREVFPAVGVYILREDDLTGQETNYGPRSAETVRFGLMTAVGSGHNGFYSCAGTDEEAGPVAGELWCLEVDDDESFVLANGLLTGNCSFQMMTGPTALSEELYILMQGTGCGFGVEGRIAVDKWPRVRRLRKLNNVDTHTIPDTTEGWCDALKLGVETWLDGGDINYNFDEIRPEGTVLKTKGGRSSGPGPLRELLTIARERIRSRAGQRLFSLDIHDITCYAHRIVQMGGVRRASGISLSDLSDTDIRKCKHGAFWETNPQRNQANNSAVYEEKPDAMTFMEEWLSLARSGTGERGIFNRGGLRHQMPKRRKLRGFTFGTNPCGEIILRDCQFCNLSIAVARPGDSIEELERKVSLATVWGTIQSTMTNFNYIRPEWKTNSEEERLLGVDILGHLDNDLLRPDSEHDRVALLSRLRDKAVSDNVGLSKLMGINQSAAVTCGKPSGDSSVFFDTAAGFKPHHGVYYLRRLRLEPTNPVAHLLKDEGVPWHNDYDNSGMWVFEFPCRAPVDNPVLLGDHTAVEQLENWKVFKVNFTEHNPSVTIYVKDDEWLDVGHWVYQNWEIVGGLSFSPFDGGHYQLMPYETIDKAEFEKRSATIPDIDWSKITRYEKSDMTTLAQQYACTSGACAT